MPSSPRRLHRTWHAHNRRFYKCSIHLHLKIVRFILTSAFRCLGANIITDFHSFVGIQYSVKILEQCKTDGVCELELVVWVLFGSISVLFTERRSGYCELQPILLLKTRKCFPGQSGAKVSLNLTAKWKWPLLC